MIEIDSSNYLGETEKYKLLIKQIEALVNKEDYLISNLANVTAVLKQSFDTISWVGFYLFDGSKLYLGPFQGKAACTSIEFGKGVCGKSAELKQTIIVPNVHEFPGHIFCDADSKSEIVIPIVKDDKLIGVLDVDSHEYNAFNEKDKLFLEEICKLLVEKVL